MGGITPRYQSLLETTQLKISLAEKDVEVLVDTNLNLREQWAFVVKKANGILGCIRPNIASRLR